jgi:hypothetical protein
MHGLTALALVSTILGAVISPASAQQSRAAATDARSEAADVRSLTKAQAAGVAIVATRDLGAAPTDVASVMSDRSAAIAKADTGLAIGPAVLAVAAAPAAGLRPADAVTAVALAVVLAPAPERAPRVEDQPLEAQVFALAAASPFTDPLTRPRRRVAPFGAEAGSFGIRLTPGVDPETEKDRTSRSPLPKARKRARKAS